MGSYISYLWWGMQDPDEANPISGLSVRDIHYAQRSWTKVSADGVACGTQLITSYFYKHPETKKFFKSFKDLPTEKLKENKQFQAHCLNIITTLTSMVDNLQKPDLVVCMCEKIGKNHTLHKISEKNFNDIKAVLVDLFVNDLHFDEATMQAWSKVVTFLFTNIFKTLEIKDL